MMAIIRTETTLEAELGVFRITVNLASLLLALERGTWNGTDIPESELFAYLSDKRVADTAGTSLAVWRRTHEFVSTRPTGLLAKAQSSLAASMETDIDAGRLAPMLLRRNIDGQIDRNQTTLAVAAVEEWAEVYGISLGDLWADYLDGEQGIAEAVLEAGNNARRALELGKELSGLRDYESLPEWAKQILFTKIDAASDVSDASGDKPLNERERGSMLAIIGALADTLLAVSPGGQSYSVFRSQTALIEVLISRYQGVPGLSQRNLEKVLPLARRRIGASV